MSLLRSLLTFSAAFALASVSSLAAADVVVLANRTLQPITVQVMSATTRPQKVELASGEVRPLFTDEPLRVGFHSRVRKSYLLGANAAYFFGTTSEGEVDLQEIGLGSDQATRTGRRLPGSAALMPARTIDVKILVDDDEATRQAIWEPRLRKRLAAASDIIERHSGISLRVVEVATWHSDNAATDFFKSLAEFEKQVEPGDAQLAIGFSSQYEVPQGRVHIGGTRGPFWSHILLREWSRHLGENEKLEFLVHELGHFLGATHSPEPDSVMRPVLGDRWARRVGFNIRFDPANTLVLAMVGEEMRRREVRKFADLTHGSKLRMKQIYTEVGRALPDDDSARRFQNLAAAGTTLPLSTATKSVLAAVNRAAVANGRNKGAEAAQKEPKRPEGDRLTDAYVRAAAKAAESMPAEVGPKAFLLAIGIALDDSQTLRTLPRVKNLVVAAETSGQRTVRVALLGKPTVHGRRDLAQHFAVSAHLTAALGAAMADAAGLSKEMLDAQGGSGFSFVDIAADRAGIHFAKAVLDGTISLHRVAESFSTGAFIPPVEGLPEGLEAQQLQEQYGTASDKRFQAQLQEIEKRIADLPPYRNRSAADQSTR